ncbi:type I-D CRISPR-associated protein Cas5/Csc1 [Sphaerospermopsis sp. FACHB-1194]|uniref:type I-D CRISPR-associated protein Cas5/Csc1 n=1 Tax=Sphaerospermopsis sp. FACHB-1194 TaxID=2692862 RepID=UPI0016810412|nr:type I-D CRISPR-associated protein Cas5/Csc1 [Sphaerospermopsis sp. FACHB-1194]MBD2144484.1 type I-D CRISPR-associated protein Cas5/Csc1 [Sphaerospermopsis sp. FACHB-1194]
MIIYQCDLTLHDNVFFASREMGILYETEKYLHNWALSFAFFETAYIPRPYRLQGEAAQKPTYLEVNQEQSLLHLNKAGIYVFPALPITWSYQVNTFKAAQVPYYGKSAQFGGEGARKNYPVNYGRAKELAIGSHFQTYILANKNIIIPHWIRLGKWSAKIKVDTTIITDVKQKSGEYITRHPLNPLDLSTTTRLLLYNRIVMPPSSLVSQAQLSGEYYELSDQTCLPLGVAYGANIK